VAQRLRQLIAAAITAEVGGSHAAGGQDDAGGLEDLAIEQADPPAGRFFQGLVTQIDRLNRLEGNDIGLGLDLDAQVVDFLLQQVDHCGSLLAGRIDPAVFLFPAHQAQVQEKCQSGPDIITMQGPPAKARFPAMIGIWTGQGIGQIAAAIAGGQDFPAQPVIFFQDEDPDRPGPGQALPFMPGLSR